MTKIAKTLSLVAVFVAVGFLGSCANAGWIDGDWEGSVRTEKGAELTTGTVNFNGDKYKTGDGVEGTFKYTKTNKTESHGVVAETGKITVDGKDCGTATYGKTGKDGIESLAFYCAGKTEGLIGVGVTKKK